MRPHILLSGAGDYPDVAVEAIVRGKIALHPAYKRDGWRITHVPTGRVIGHFRTCHQARAAFRQIAIFDWRFVSKSGEAYDVARNAVPDIVRRCGGVPYDPHPIEAAA